MLKRLSILSALLLMAASLFAAQNDVAVIYHGRTSVNGHAIGFLQQQFNELGTGLRVRPIAAGQSIHPENYGAVVIMNTGRSSGVDPVFSDTINQAKDSTTTIIVSLKRGRRSTSVETASSYAQFSGVDAVTAASAWGGRGLSALFGGGGSSRYQMHVEWASQVASMING